MIEFDDLTELDKEFLFDPQRLCDKLYELSYRLQDDPEDNAALIAAFCYVAKVMIAKANMAMIEKNGETMQ